MSIKLRTNITKKKYLLISFSGILAFFLIWSFLSYGGLINNIFLPEPIHTFKNLLSLILDQNILHDVYVSILRVLAGFIISVLIGIPVGILSGSFRPIQAFIETNISFLRYVPVAAFIPLAILWFGVGNAEKIFLIFIGVIPYTVLYISVAASNVEREYIEVAKTLGASDIQLLSKIVVPRALPNIWDISRIEMGGAWALAILAEVVAANSGLGYRLVLAQRFLHTEDMFSLILIIGAIGLMLDSIFSVSYNTLFPWAERVK